jgi:UDP-N-acetylmuramyl pentapeptide phosphotransferase/UDP-N-acetylglucosamine-1-phosphate transferase
MTLSPFILPSLFALGATFIACLGLIATLGMHGHLTLDTRPGVQKIHDDHAPRVGGIALLIGALAGGLAMPSAGQALWWMILLSLLPSFVAGTLEDITDQVGVRLRLLATILSGLLFCLLTGIWITRVDLAGVDWLLSLTPFAVLFTGFAIGGVANALNIIDGAHGLASGTAILILSGFAILAWQSNDAGLLACILTAIALLAGFFVLNFPYGRIFMGDAGAVMAGFLLASVAVALPQRNPEYSPLIGLIALAYPVTETLVSIIRRLNRKGGNPGAADRLHLHSLVYRSRARRFATRLGLPQHRNAATSVLVGALPLLTTGLTIWNPESSGQTLLEVAVVVVVYLWAYRSVALLPPLFRPSRRPPRVDATAVKQGR